METHEIILLNLLMNLIRYFLFAGIAYLIFYIIKSNKWANKKIQSKYPDSKQIFEEIKNSLISILIFAFVGVVIYTLSKNGLTKLYRNVEDFSVFYFVLSILILIFWHDTYFYWSHKLLHHPVFFRFHLTHHKSHNTTPFTAFSFHPLEALVQTGFLVILFIMPVHVLALALTMFWQMFFNVIGHLGFEIFPKKLHNTKFGKLFNTVTHHNMHHRFTNQNFGLYFNVWDRIMKTNHKDYEKHYVINATKMYLKS